MTENSRKSCDLLKQIDPKLPQTGQNFPIQPGNAVTTLRFSFTYAVTTLRFSFTLYFLRGNR